MSLPSTSKRSGKGKVKPIVIPKASLPSHVQKELEAKAAQMLQAKVSEATSADIQAMNVEDFSKPAPCALKMGNPAYQELKQLVSQSVETSLCSEITEVEITSSFLKVKVSLSAPDAALGDEPLATLSLLVPVDLVFH